MAAIHQFLANSLQFVKKKNILQGLRGKTVVYKSIKDYQRSLFISLQNAL